MAFNVVAELCKLPELFELVLLHLTQRELLHAQRVNKYWADLITQSPALQQKLFFQPILPAEASCRKPETNPLAEEFFPFLFGPRHVPDRRDFWSCDRVVQSMGHWSGDRHHRDAVLRPEASWRRMLPVQPAARLDGVIITSWGCTGLRGLTWCEVDASKYVQAPRTTGQTPHNTCPDLDLGTCATMGLLYDIVLHQLGNRSNRTIGVQWQMFPEALIPRTSSANRLSLIQGEANTETDTEATFGNSRCIPTRPENMKLRNKITVHCAVFNRPAFPRAPSPTGFKILDVPKGLVRGGKEAKHYMDDLSIVEYEVWGRLPGVDSD